MLAVAAVADISYDVFLYVTLSSKAGHPECNLMQ